MSDGHIAVIEGFYGAFSERDHETMASFLHPDITFSDPVFRSLQGREVAAMWHMLCAQGADLRLTVDSVTASDDGGAAHWEPRYTFGPTGRLVHNRIDARFRFAGGLIVEHTDDFDLWKWTRMALGTTGLVLGWTPAIKNRIRATARGSLRRFIDDHPEYRG